MFADQRVISRRVDMYDYYYIYIYISTYIPAVTFLSFFFREWWNPSSRKGTGPLHSMNVTRVQHIVRCEGQVYRESVLSLLLWGVADTAKGFLIERGRYIFMALI